MSSKNRRIKTLDYDFYPTPTDVLDQIFNEIKWDNISTFRDPAKGDGYFLEKVNKEYPSIITDYYEIREGKDYLQEDNRDIVDLECTNPPFSLTMEFFEKSLKYSKSTIFLQRLNYLGSQRRKQFWQSINLTHLFVLSKRPKFAKKCKQCNILLHPKKQTCPYCNGKIAYQSDSIEYAWFVLNGENSIKKSNGIYWL